MHPVLIDESEEVRLLPTYEDEGHLYMGISGLEAPSTLSVFFQLAEGSANPDLERSPIRWSVLVGNRWQELASTDILSDSTNGLLVSGLIVFDITKTATNDTSLIPGGYHWLRARNYKNTAAIKMTTND